jgi:hypothetical protein
MLFIPLGNDLVVFDLGGRLIVDHGAVPYRDFIDMKQPLIYYLYGMASFLFGQHEVAIRIFDLIYHGAAFVLFYRLLKNVGYDKSIAITSVLCYAVYYGGSIGSATAEPFAFLPQIVIAGLLLQSAQDDKSRPFFAGGVIAIMLMILTLLKATFIIAAGPILIFGLLFIPLKRNIRLILAMTLTFAVLLGSYFVWLSSVGAMRGTLQVMSWLNGYASIVPLISVQTFKTFYYKILPSQFLLTFAPTFVMLLLVAIIRRPPASPFKTDQTPLSLFRFLCLLSIVFGIVGIAFERKGFNYHFTRIAWCIVPFVAESIVSAWNVILQILQTLSAQMFFRKLSIWGGIVVGSVLIFLFSPIPRLIDQPVAWSLLRPQHDIPRENEKLGENDNTEIRTLALKYKPQLDNTASIFLWGNCARTYYEFNKLPTTICILNPEFVSPWTPSEWIDTLSSQLKSNQPQLFVCQRNDARFGINGTNEDSYHALLRIPSLKQLLMNGYTLADSTEHFYLYLRR